MLQTTFSKKFFFVFVSFMAIFTLFTEISAARASHDWLHFLPVILVLASMWLQAWVTRKKEQSLEILWAISLGYMAVEFLRI